MRVNSLYDLLSNKCNKSAPNRNRDYDKMFAVGRNMRFTDWLQAELDKRGWSQSDCARACDLNRAVINKLINGKCKPQPVTLMALARGFKMPVEATYRAAGLLPPSNDSDEEVQEVIYIFTSLRRS